MDKYVLTRYLDSSSTRVVGESIHDLDEMLRLLAVFLQAAGWTYVEKLEAIRIGDERSETIFRSDIAGEARKLKKRRKSVEK